MTLMYIRLIKVVEVYARAQCYQAGSLSKLKPTKLGTSKLGLPHYTNPNPNLIPISSRIPKLNP